jgi:hypothetical protein
LKSSVTDTHERRANRMDSCEWLEKFYKTEAGKRALRKFRAAMPAR